MDSTVECIYTCLYMKMYVVYHLNFDFVNLLQRRAERESQFNKMSYNDSDRAKWKKVLITEFMSSDESGTEDGEPVFIVKTLPWRSERVSKFFQRLDAARDARKSEQANRQTKPRVYKDLVSSRPLPTTCAVPTWAVVL